MGDGEGSRSGCGCGGCLSSLLTLLFLLAVAGALGWWLALPRWLEARLEEATGCPAEVAAVEGNPFAGRIVARGVRLDSPPSFPEREFIDLRRLELVLDVPTLWSGEALRVRSIEFDIPVLSLVTDAAGRRNDLEVRRRPEEGPAVEADPARPARPARPVVIEQMRVRLGRLRLADHRVQPPEVSEVVLGLDLDLDDVGSPADVAPRVAVEAGQAVAEALDAAGLTGDLVREVHDQAAAIAAEAARRAQAAGSEAAEFAREVFDILTGTREPADQ